MGERYHSNGTLTVVGEDLARERWRAARPHVGLGGPPRLMRCFTRPRETIVRREDRACPNCGHVASWLARRTGKRCEELRRRGESDYSCRNRGVRWTVYLEPVDGRGGYDPLGDHGGGRLRWRYRGGCLYGEEVAPPDHQPRAL